MNISKRLLRISEFVDAGSTVFDVGSDHGLLPCFLIKNNICLKVYAGDNKKGPLEKAIQNIKQFQLEDRIIPLLSDGLDLAGEDVEIVTISGMGQAVVEKILDKAKLNQYKKIIVQVNRDMDLLRKYISEHNYTIIDEDIVFDHYFYEVIVFNTKFHEKYNDEEIKFGPINLKNKKEVFKNYLNYNLNKYLDILKQHPGADLKEKNNEIEKVLHTYF